MKPLGIAKVVKSYFEQVEGCFSIFYDAGIRSIRDTTVYEEVVKGFVKVSLIGTFAFY